jgi:hypothetical protein
MLKSFVVLAALATTLAGFTASASAAGPDLRLDLSGAGTGRVTSEFGGYRQVTSLTLSGKATRGGPVRGSATSDATYLAQQSGAPSAFVLTLTGGTIFGHVQNITPGLCQVNCSRFPSRDINGNSPVFPLSLDWVVDGGTGRYGRFSGGLLKVSLESVFAPGPNNWPPPYDTVVISALITGTLLG